MIPVTGLNPEQLNPAASAAAGPASRAPQWLQEIEQVQLDAGSAQQSADSNVQVQQQPRVRALIAAEVALRRGSNSPPRAATGIAESMKRVSQQSSGGGAAAAAEGDVESPAAGKAKRASGLSAGGAAEKETDSPRTRKRKRRKLCCVLSLLLALIAAGIGVGVWQGVEKGRPKLAVQQQQQPAGPLTFRVTVGAPTAEQSAVACAKWFGDKQQLDNYSAVFSASYATALKLPPSYFNVDAVKCGGAPMTSSSSSSSRVGPSRHLLAAMVDNPGAAAAGMRGAPQSLVQQGSSGRPKAGPAAALLAAAPTAGAGAKDTDIVTTFSVPAPADEAARTERTRNIMANSEGILTDPLSQFFGVPVKFKGIEQLDASGAPIAAADGTAAGTAAREVPGERPPPASPVSPRQPAGITPPPGVTRPLVPAPVPPPVLAPVLTEPPPLELPIPDEKQQQQPRKPPPPVPNPKPQKPSKPGKGPKPSPAQGFDPLYDTAPSCSSAPTMANSVADTLDRLWGWENWQSCVFRGFTSVQPEVVNSAWEAAPPCKAQPNSGNSAADPDGMLWGWEQSGSCAFRRADYKPNLQRPVLTWTAAPNCNFAPSDVNSVADSSGQLWGWQAGQSCGFKGRYSEGSSQGQITWFAAPSCRFTPTTANSKPDVDGRLWGWQAKKEGGKMESCAFRPAEP
ncbi:hypothetical protein OEZ85_006556 [Tetradesmus obliquus]|uniref:Uncharacterized protein n=1 Tax=Tetradesmus obliquus TaxID=3088 RepID=A0ABY8TUZ3_TETOB|nr:hypothetical protein OEZ85_006556 [Tetradesmus obliquus]